MLGARVEESSEDTTQGAADVAQSTEDTTSSTGSTGTTETGSTGAAAAGTKIASPETPLAETPFDNGAGMTWAWILGAGAAAGAGAVGYGALGSKAGVKNVFKRKKK